MKANRLNARALDIGHSLREVRRFTTLLESAARKLCALTDDPAELVRQSQELAEVNETKALMIRRRELLKDELRLLRRRDRNEGRHV